jgi:hypothetical protein
MGPTLVRTFLLIIALLAIAGVAAMFWKAPVNSVIAKPPSRKT